MATVNRLYKDSLFCRLFGSEEYKRNALELYNALAGAKHRDITEIEVTTIENTVYLGRKNDVAFIVGDEIVLMEHQSTNNPNMPLRGLQYFAKLYTRYVEQGGYDLYGRKPIPLPCPRFFVLCFAGQSVPEREVVRLSDSFAKGSGDVEVTATVLNCTEGSNEDIMKACEALRGYAHLIALERSFCKSGSMAIEDAVRAAVVQCINDGYLVDYLMAHRAEAEDMLFTMEDEERAMRVHWEAVEREAREVGFEKGMKQGIEQGLVEGRREERQALIANAAQMVKAGTLTLQQAVEGLSLTEDEIRNATF